MARRCGLQALVLPAALALLAALLARGGGSASGWGAAADGPIPREDIPPPELHFCPAEPCAGILARAIRSANRSADCALYELDEPSVVAALRDARARVVVHEARPAALGGVSYREGHAPQVLMHDKFCVIDGELVVAGSFNPTASGGARNDNALVLVRSRLLAAAYEAEFGELWEGTFSGGARTDVPAMELGGSRWEVAFCPEDGCRERLLAALGEARESIRFLAFSFSDREVAEALLAARRRGVEVKGVCERTQARRYNRCIGLREAGLAVRDDGNPAMMHHKTFIIDGATVVTGSANTSSGGFDENDENLLVIRDGAVAAAFSREFARVWSESTP